METFGWMTSMVQGIFGGVQGVLDHVRQGARAIGARIIRRMGLLFFVVLGVVFFLVGLARFLDEVYQVPGAGEMVVGIFVFCGALLIYLIDSQNNS